MCGTCSGKKVIWCGFCMDGCSVCKGVGDIACPSCNGGSIPVPPPNWL